jgi:hypothetical protein
MLRDELMKLKIFHMYQLGEIEDYKGRCKQVIRKNRKIYAQRNKQVNGHKCRETNRLNYLCKHKRLFHTRLRNFTIRNTERNAAQNS